MPVLPVIRNGQLNPRLFARGLGLIAYRTPPNSQSMLYEVTADVAVSQVECWITSIYVSISPTFVPVGNLQVIVWDSNGVRGNPALMTPAGAASGGNSERIVDSPFVTPGETWWYEPQTTLTYVHPDGTLQVNLGQYCQRGCRVQVIDDNNYEPITLGARFECVVVGPYP